MNFIMTGDYTIKAGYLYVLEIHRKNAKMNMIKHIGIMGKNPFTKKLTELAFKRKKRRKKSNPIY